MRILLIDHAKSHFEKQNTGRWHFLPLEFKKAGHKILHLTKKDWKKFPLHYLRFKPNIIITTGLAALIPIKLKQLGLVKAPIVYDWNDYWNEIFSGKLGIQRAASLEAYAVEKSDFLTTPSKYLASKAEILGRKAEFIPHGIIKENFPKKVELKGKFKLVYIGAQTPYKKVHRIVEAVKNLQCDLYLIGKPNENLKARAGKNVHFLGQIPYSEINSYIKAADICICTADQENLKMYEYVAAGKPILAYKGRIAYFLSHLENAYLTEDLREGLQELIKNPSLRKKLAKNAKKIQIKSWEEISKIYLNFLNNIIKRKPN